MKIEPIYKRPDYKSLNNMFEVLIKKYKKLKLKEIEDTEKYISVVDSYKHRIKLVSELCFEIKRTRKKFKHKLKKVCYRN